MNQERIVRRDILYSFIYILRIWCDGARDGTPVWHFTVEDTASGERRGFSELVDVAHFIQAEMEAGLSTNGDSAASRG